jgi:glycerophosphoryl diester phosphodiesterase
MKKNKAISLINPLFLKGIAHRGLHNKELTENGLKAFQNAIDNNLAFELDVHLTSDKQLIVCHDSSLKRTTGKEGIIEEMSLKEVKDNYRLLDGEEVPSFKEVLELNKEKMPIVVELKAYKNNNKELAEEVRKELTVIKDKKNIMIISFDPRALLYMKKAHFLRSLLVSDDKEHAWIYRLRFLFESVDLDYQFLREKRVQKYAEKHLVNTWTIDSKEKFDLVYPYVNAVTFQLMDKDYVVSKMKEKNKDYLN